VRLDGIVACPTTFSVNCALKKRSFQAAKGQLAAANDMKKTQFGGHRVKAIELLELAEKEIAAAAAAAAAYAESDAK
jgi:hypothetical protein